MTEERTTLDVIESYREAFLMASRVLFELCALKPDQAENFQLRFEPSEKKFVISWSGQDQLYWTRLLAKSLLLPYRFDYPKLTAKDIIRGWNKLK
jgi:hypothetical protein